MEPIQKQQTDKEASYKFYNSTEVWYDDVVTDIANAQHYVCLETFRIGNDSVGNQISNALIAAHQRGVRVKLLIDWWGASGKNPYIVKMITAGINVRFFKKFVISPFMFKRNHCRDHRKIIVIDDNISYIGSANFTQYCKAWRESILRMKGDIAITLKKIFMDNYKIYNKDFSIYEVSKRFHKTIRYDNCFFIREVPSVFGQRIKKNYLRCIERAEKQITIETPYFLPGHRIYKSLINAVKRGVEVNVCIPQHSDVKVADVVRDAFLEQLYKHGVNIYLYPKGNLHSKLMLIDDNVFAIGSANMDNRSFRYMFEIAMLGSNPEIVKLIASHNLQTKQMSLPFDETFYNSRTIAEKILTFIALPFSHLL